MLSTGQKLLGVIGLVACWQGVQAVESAQSWVQDMSTAFSTLDYQGTFIYSHSEGLETLKIIHSVKDGAEKERLIHLDGPHRELIRDGNMVTCWLPKNASDSKQTNHAIPSGPFSKAFSRDFSQLDEFYEIKWAGEDRVATHSAKVVQVSPKDDYRFGYRLWLEENSKLLLKSELLNHDGQAIEVFQFTDLKIGGNIPESSFKFSDQADFMSVQRDINDLQAPQNKQQQSTLWSPRWLPAGFAKAPANNNRMTNTDKQEMKAVDTMMYTDGLSAFTVFIENAQDNQLTEGTTFMGGVTVAVVRRVGAPGKGHWVTVVGEVPEKTAKKVADSFAHRASFGTGSVVNDKPALESMGGVPSTGGNKF